MKILILTTVLLTLLLPAITLAQVTKTPVQALQGGLEATNLDPETKQNTFPTGKKSTNVNVILGRIVNSAFALLGAIVLTITIVGGLLWMMAGGNEEKIKRAKGFIGNGINGMIVIFFSYGLVYIILKGLDVGAKSAQ